MSKPIELIAQRSSFGYVIVDSENANPDWVNAPFRVIDYKAYEELQRKLEIAKEYMNHKNNCDHIRADGWPCDCGYKEALKKVGEIK